MRLPRTLSLVMALICTCVIIGSTDVTAAFALCPAGNGDGYAYAGEYSNAASFEDWNAM